VCRQDEGLRQVNPPRAHAWLCDGDAAGWAPSDRWHFIVVLLGWQTRIAALAAAAFIGFTVLLALPKGWFWMRGGTEYPLMWTAVLLALALAGPGAWALDGQHLPGDLA